VWLPADRALVLTLAPVSIAPSTLDVQASDADRSPSSTSFAVPVSVTASPAFTVVPSGGELIPTVGGPFTVSVISA
jgi:hypothetical protein